MSGWGSLEVKQFLWFGDLMMGGFDDLMNSWIHDDCDGDDDDDDDDDVYDRYSKNSFERLCSMLVLHCFTCHGSGQFFVRSKRWLATKTWCSFWLLVLFWVKLFLGSQHFCTGPFSLLSHWRLHVGATKGVILLRLPFESPCLKTHIASVLDFSGGIDM